MTRKVTQERQHRIGSGDNSGGYQRQGMGKNLIEVNYVRAQEVLQKYRSITEIMNTPEGCDI